MLMLHRIILTVALATALPQPAPAEELPRVSLVLKDHRFQPAELHLAPGRATLLVIENRDSTPEEFESSALKVEKVVGPGQTVQLRLRPLAPGRYSFIGEFHPSTAQGVVIVE